MIAHQPAQTLPRTTPAAGTRSVTNMLISILHSPYLKLSLLVLAGALLVGSLLLPYWTLVLHAPQYPKGLEVDVFTYKMTPAKNVREVDGLNHYIGMIRLTDAAELERAVSRSAGSTTPATRSTRMRR
jgi:hypothetical protein